MRDNNFPFHAPPWSAPRKICFTEANLRICKIQSCLLYTSDAADER
nr:hypothetical protein [Pedobacter sp. ASV19]